MPYILLAIGVLVGLYAIYRFMMVASAPQVKALFLTMALVAVGIGVFVMAITGKLPAALALVGAMIPLVLGLRSEKKAQQQAQDIQSGAVTLSVHEAYEVLGLEDGASAEEIEKAYKKLMKKVHPDQEGSQWMATKLNHAREILLKDKEHGDDSNAAS